MAQYVTCEYCGCNPDFGEQCDCKKEKGVPPQPVHPKVKHLVHSISSKQKNVNKIGGIRHEY